MDNKRKSRTDIQAEAWARWWQADFSWDNIAELGGSANYENLQSYWRTDPTTGKLRSDEELKVSGELILVEGQPAFHIAHLPLYYADGSPTMKSTDTAACQARLDTVLDVRLHKANEVARATQDNSPRTEEPERAIFDGVVFLKFGFLDHTLPEIRIDCILAIFADVVALDGVRLSGEVDFTWAYFPQSVEFNETVFPGPAIFKHARFAESATFRGSNFLETSDFNGAKFAADAEFDEVTFHGAATFNSAVFEGDVKFYQASFYDQASFDHVRFLKDADFSHTIFEGNATFKFLKANALDFYDARFRLDCTFGWSRISGTSSFFDAAFSRRCDFQYCQFGDDTDFSYARIDGDLRFGSSSFGGNANFSSAKCLGTAYFDETRFLKTASFWDCTFADHVSFGKAKFFDDLDITSTQFEKTPSLNEVIFKEPAILTNFTISSYCAFDDAIFQSGAVLKKIEETEELARLDAELGLILKISDRTERDSRLRSFESGCRVIKKLVVDKLDRNREQLLFKYELIARRSQRNTPAVEKFFSSMYQYFSDYGSNQIKPLKGMVWLLVAFSIAYALFDLPGNLPSWDEMNKGTARYTANLTATAQTLGHAPLKDGNAERLRLAIFPDQVVEPATKYLSITASRVFPFGAFGDKSEAFAHELELERRAASALLFRTLATLESFLALTLAFLFALSVKRRFQIA